MYAYLDVDMHVDIIVIAVVCVRVRLRYLDWCADVYVKLASMQQLPRRMECHA